MPDRAAPTSIDRDDDRELWATWEAIMAHYAGLAALNPEPSPKAAAAVLDHDLGVIAKKLSDLLELGQAPPPDYKAQFDHFHAELSRRARAWAGR